MNWEILANQSIDMLSVSDTKGRFVWLNTRWTEVLGWSIEELTSMEYTMFVHPDDLEATFVEATRLIDLEGYESHQFVNRYRRRDGGYTSLEWNATRGEDGMLYAIVRDVTERVEREIAHREQLALLEAIETQTQIGRWRVDLRTGETRWSPSVFRIMGLEHSPVVSLEHSGLEMIHSDDRERLQDVFLGAMERGEPFKIDTRVVRSSDEVRWIALEGLVVRAHDGAPVVMHGIVRDTTEERARAKRLVHTERLASIGQLAAGVAHEINNPLQFMNMNLELLREELGELDLGPDVCRESIEGALEGAERVRKIVGALRRFVRRPGEKRARISPSTLLDGVLRMVKGRFAQYVWLELELEDDLPLIEVEEQAISQSLLNLITNACQSVYQTGEHGRVRVRVCRELGDMGAQVAFEVIDDGVGLEVDEPERVFEPFFTTKAAGVGTGLGLSITRGLVAAHGGGVTLTDRDDDRGAIARLTLPVPFASAPGDGLMPESSDVYVLGGKSSSVKASEPEAPRGPRVLLVDDEPTIVRALARHLRTRGYEVETARGGSEALDLLSAKGARWDMVLCDLKMPEVDGRALRARMLEVCPEVEPRLHFMTGDSWSFENRDFLESLHRPHLDKPFVLSELRAFVEANLPC